MTSDGGVERERNETGQCRRPASSNSKRRSGCLRRDQRGERSGWKHRTMMPARVLRGRRLDLAKERLELVDGARESDGDSLRRIAVRGRAMKRSRVLQRVERSDRASQTCERERRRQRSPELLHAPFEALEALPKLALEIFCGHAVEAVEFGSLRGHVAVDDLRGLFQ